MRLPKTFRDSYRISPLFQTACGVCIVLFFHCWILWKNNLIQLNIWMFRLFTNIILLFLSKFVYWMECNMYVYSMLWRPCKLSYELLVKLSRCCCCWEHYLYCSLVVHQWPCSLPLLVYKPSFSVHLCKLLVLSTRSLSVTARAISIFKTLLYQSGYHWTLCLYMVMSMGFFYCLSSSHWFCYRNWWLWCSFFD